MLLSLLALAFYVAGAFSAVNAAMTARTATGAVAWVVALVSFPFVAVPAYWVFGRSKFQGFVDAYESERDRIDHIVEEIAEHLEPEAVRLEGHVPFYDALRALSGNSLVGNNDVDLLVDGEAIFESLLAGIADARDYVLVQYYILRDDDTGRRLKTALLERARAGVTVFVLYDEIGCMSLPNSYCKELGDAGVHVSSFQPNRGRNNRFQLNFRNHRKIVIVDGAAGWLGGCNVGDEYLGRDPDFSPWRDTHVRLRGPAVIQLQGVFASDWYWATRKLPELSWRPVQADGSDVRAMIVPSAPTQKIETAGMMYVMALNAARERLWLTAPYFVPDEAVMKALALAALRGVEIRILLAGTSDSVLANLASYHFIARLNGLGIRFTEYRPGFLHQKVALVDDHTSLIGTANFDNRSFELNYE
ncbi:MAG TPA: cardiolipin synthase, partial [Woeseiaceae bacterium]|nr:cardiolipin synthase [Woeseiaceae bacterium]